MSLTYVIPDIHGRADLLDEALARIDTHAAGNGGTLVLLGDYVSKGPDSRGVIERLETNPPRDFKFVALKGNHDAMMVSALRDGADMSEWLAKGGASTLASYGDAAAVPQSHIDWLDVRPLMHEDVHRIYVHAGLNPVLPLYAQSEKVLLWKRYGRDETGGYGARHVVHGHDNAVDGPLLFEGRSNLDTCAWRTGQLVIGVFDDDVPGGPVGFITVQGPAAAS
ncbi:MAG: metallophosphoesterase [Xanthobacteraceae bacterium]|nr:metallophosphoesterase [Xanthobacteraceae bacterium]